MEGFTLLELVVAIGLWMMLLLGASHLLWYTAETSAQMLRRHETLEAARVALDTLIVNLQMADEIRLRTEPCGTLINLATQQIDPEGADHFFGFTYNRPTAAGYMRLESAGYICGLGFRPAFNEIASGLTELRLMLSDCGNIIHISLRAEQGPGSSVSLSSAVNIEHKTFIQR